jgi:hypothetical protein
MCSVCESDENLKEGVNEKGETISLCDACRTCEGCDQEVDEEIDSTNWILTTRIIRPAGWIFQDPSTFKRYKEYALYCGACCWLFCSVCESLECKDRCEECSAPCSEGCSCKES